MNPNSQQNPGLEAYNNSINLANNQLNPTNTLGANRDSDKNEKNKLKNINLLAEEAKNVNNFDDIKQEGEKEKK